MDCHVFTPPPQFSLSPFSIFYWKPQQIPLTLSYLHFMYGPVSLIRIPCPGISWRLFFEARATYWQLHHWRKWLPFHTVHSSGWDFAWNFLFVSLDFSLPSSFQLDFSSVFLLIEFDFHVWNWLPYFLQLLVLPFKCICVLFELVKYIGNFFLVVCLEFCLGNLHWGAITVELVILGGNKIVFIFHTPGGFVLGTP